MGIIIKKRFGPRNFVQQLGFKDVYTIGPKKKKAQQVGFDNPQEYIIPQNDINDFTRDMQQSYNTAQKGASKTFANYYGGTGDTRGFIHTAKPLPPVATSMDRLIEDYDRNLAVSTRNRNRACNLAEGLVGQKLEFLKDILYGKKTKAKYENIRSWANRARATVDRNHQFNEVADQLRVLLYQKHTLPGYFRTWVSRTTTLHPDLLSKGAMLKRVMQLKSKQEVLNRAKWLVALKASRLKEQAEYAHELKRAEAMAAVDLERDGTQGGFFSQVGTNLSTPGSVKKLSPSAKQLSSTKKSAEKSEQTQQTTPTLELRRGVTLPTKAKTPSTVGTIPKRLTEEAEARFGNRFKEYARASQRSYVQRGAAALGLSDPIQTVTTKRKLLNTPGGTPGLPA